MEPNMKKKLVDLSHTIKKGMITYQGLPGPVISDFMSRKDSAEHYAEGTSFQIGKIELVTNTGTYIDSPFHRFADGRDLSRLELTWIADLEGILFRTDPSRRIVDADIFEGAQLNGRAVLICTGWSRHWGTDRYFKDHPYLTEKAAEFLRESGAALVGIDSYNIDDNTDGRRPAHTVLLGANIPVVEHLNNLDALPDSGFRFFAVPPKIVGLASFPTRAFAIISAP
jgi:kynurenine formamidase